METTKPRNNAKFTSLFLWLFMAIGIAAIGFGAWDLFRGLRCRNWPVVDGIIRTSEIRRESGGKGGPTYAPHVSYDYSAAGSRFTSEQIAFGMMSASSSYASRYTHKYTVGKKVTVHYNPADPSEAVLETGEHGGMWICFGVGTMFVLYASLMLKFANLGRPSSPEQTVKQSNSLQHLMGIIVILMGLSVGIAGYVSQSSNIIPIVGAGFVFCIAGLYVMTYRPQPTALSNILRITLVVVMLAIFNWVVFGMADRIVTPTVNTTKIDPFAATIILIIDAAFLLVVIVTLKKKLRSATSR